MKLICLVVLLLSSRCDALTDRNFDPQRLTYWRKPLPFVGDLWHIAKWGRMYPPMVLVCWFGFGWAWPWWVGAIIGSWIVWNIGSPWKSRWI